VDHYPQAIGSFGVTEVGLSAKRKDLEGEPSQVLSYNLAGLELFFALTRKRIGIEETLAASHVRDMNGKINPNSNGMTEVILCRIECPFFNCLSNSFRQ